MVVTIANRARPAIDLLLPAVNSVRTVVIPVLLRQVGEPLFLVPRGLNLILEATASSTNRDAACELATRLIASLPVPALRDARRCIPAFEHMPAVGDPTACVTRVMSAPIVSDTIPLLDRDGDDWLVWVSLALLSASLVYLYAALALARARTYLPTISREVLDELLAASTRLRTGARAPKMLRTTSKLTSGTSKLTWRQARAKTFAADDVLRRALLSVSSEEPYAEILHAFADRILPFDDEEIPIRFKADFALPDFSDPRLRLTPYTTRVQPPRTVPLPPAPRQPAPPPSFRPQHLGDLLTEQGIQELSEWFEKMYEWLLLLDEWSVQMPRYRHALKQRIVDLLQQPQFTAEQLAQLLATDVDEPFRSATDLLHQHPPLRQALLAESTTSDRSDVDWLRDLILERVSIEPEAPGEDDIVRLLVQSRPEPLALGKSRFRPEAHGIVWDLRTLPPVPVDYREPLKTQLNLQLIKQWKAKFSTWPDQELFDHLLTGVRLKAPNEYQMILQPHLSSLPLGYVNVHKELKRLVDKKFFAYYANIPFAPWQTLPMGVAFRKLEPDRPRRTTDGGSPRRGAKPSYDTDQFGDKFERKGSSTWLVDTDGVRVLPINVSSRWPEDDVRRGTLDVFYQSWQETLPELRAGSPPPFHPLSSRLGQPSPSGSRASSPSPKVDARPVLLVFSGPGTAGSLGQALAASGLLVVQLDTIIGGPDHDVLNPVIAEAYIRRAQEGAYSFVHLAPPCNPFSIRASHRPALFTLREPQGIAAPPPEWAAYLHRARQIVAFVADFLEALDRSNTPWSLENPSRRHRKGDQSYWEEFREWATLWDALEDRGITSRMEVIEANFALCALGAPYQKFTTLWTSSSASLMAEPFHNLRCVHIGKRIPHAVRLEGFDSQGQSLSAQAAAYPPVMVQKMAKAILLLVTPAEECAICEGGSAMQISLSSIPAAPALRVGTVVDVDITRGGPTPHFANPFKMGPNGTDARLRGMSVATYSDWLASRTVSASSWPTGLPVSRRLAHLTGADVERALENLFASYGRSSRFHFICGPRCFGKACHGTVLISLARQVAGASDDPPFPKELKVTVAENMSDLAVLMHLSYLTGLQVYQINTDVADFFNRHSLHPMEVPRVGLITLEVDLLLRYAGRLRQRSPEMVNIAESVLGYGLFQGSEICQRHAYLLCFVWVVEMIERSRPIVAALEIRYPALRSWREDRASLEPCSDSVDPTAAVRFGQTRLFVNSMYSDDGFKGVLGVDLTILALKVEIGIMTELRMDLAIVAKQSLGQSGTNQGIRFQTGLGIAYVPQDKARRAQAGIAAARKGSATAREYHSTLGLLQSLLFVSGLRKSSMFGLWSVFSGANSLAGEDRVNLSPFAIDRLDEWSQRLALCAGASFEAGVEKIHEDNRIELPPEARSVVILRSDASKEGTLLPGLGGAHGGAGWRYPNDCPLSSEELSLPIAVTEFAAFFGEVEVFGPDVPEETLILAEVDALSTVDALVDEAARAPMMQHIFNRLEALPAWQRIRNRVILAHTEGSRNLMADAFSRGYFTTAQEICRQFGMAFERRPHGPQLTKLMTELVALLPPAVGPSSSDFIPHRDSFEHSAGRPQSPKHASSPNALPFWPACAGLSHDLPQDSSLLSPRSSHFERTPPATPQALPTPSLQTSSPWVESSSITPTLLHFSPSTHSPGSGITHGLPTIPPFTPQSDKRPRELSFGEEVTAKRVSLLLSEDTSRFALRPTSFSLESLCLELYDPGKATPHNTARGHRSAWKHWFAWCQIHNTDPWRLVRHTSDLAIERETVLQAGFLRFVHARQSASPRNGRAAALPSSAAKTLGHIRKMHKDRGFPMVSSTLVQTNVRKLLMEYKARHGVKDLIPKRKQPFTREILLDTIVGTPDGYSLGRYEVKRNSRKWRSIVALTKTAAQTGFRKSEFTVNKYGQPCDADCLSRASLRWRLAGKIYHSGEVPAHLLREAQPNDFAILTPPPSKSDPFDMVWGDKPIWLPHSQDPLSAFEALSHIELEDPIRETASLTALFSDDDGLPFSGSQLDTLLHHMLLRHYPPQTAGLYSWHSARIFLCCALMASNCSRAMIQAVCRWQTEESINVYSCLGAEQYGEILKNAMAARIDGARAATLSNAAPFIDLSDLQHAQVNSVRNLATAAEQIDTPPEPDDDADLD